MDSSFLTIQGIINTKYPQYVSQYFELLKLRIIMMI